jgi:hypothetical protein
VGRKLVLLNILCRRDLLSWSWQQKARKFADHKYQIPLTGAPSIIARGIEYMFATFERCIIDLRLKAAK